MHAFNGWTCVSHKEYARYVIKTQCLELGMTHPLACAQDAVLAQRRGGCYQQQRCCHQPCNSTSGNRMPPFADFVWGLAWNHTIVKITDSLPAFLGENLRTWQHVRHDSCGGVTGSSTSMQTSSCALMLCDMLLNVTWVSAFFGRLTLLRALQNHIMARGELANCLMSGGCSYFSRKRSAPPA